MGKIIIPETLKVGQVSVKVRYMEEVSCIGESRFDGAGSEIILDRRSEGDFLENVFLHELVHTMLNHLGQEGASGDEALVQGLTNMLHEVIPQITK
jgi:hypothetical protein